ncbi:MAG: carboxypeptidase-like regulatory domain-containing protein, partial [Pseudonocardiaceae bacterium]|nr:carboxypeptidase-like regulatory domain-containing protein [Pseudonocardiaceae bacterium]
MYGDADRDGQVDAGEPLVGVPVKIVGGMLGKAFEGRTDAAGTVRHRGLPGGRYSLQVALPNGWQTEFNQYVDVRAGDNVRVVRAVRDDGRSLAATIRLDRDRYSVGDTVGLRITGGHRRECGRAGRGRFVAGAVRRRAAVRPAAAPRLK